MERGWCPENKCLLSNADILRTKPRPTDDENLPQPVSFIGRDKRTISNVSSDLSDDTDAIFLPPSTSLPVMLEIIPLTPRLFGKAGTNI